MPGAKPRLLVMNKIDLLDETERRELALRHRDAVLVSAETGEGLDELRSRIAELIRREPRRGRVARTLCRMVSAFRSFTKSLATSSAKIARTGFTFALSFLPGTRSGSPTSPSTDGRARSRRPTRRQSSGV